MGDFSKLTVKAEIEALAATVSGEEVKLQKLVDGLTKRCLALGSIDKANYASTLAVARAITGVLCAGLGFLPLVGPPMLAVVGPVLNAALTTAFTVQDKGKAVTVLQVMAATASTFAKAAVPVAGGLPESVLFHMAAEFGMSRTSADDPKKPATVGGMPAGGFFTTTGSAGGELVAQVAKFEPHLVRPRTGKAKTPSVETAKTATYVVALAKQGMRTGYAWIDQRPDDGVLLPLVFYSLLDQQAAGGRGAQLMETGVIFASGKIDAESMLRPLAQVRDALRRVAGYGTLGHKSSRLIDRLDRWKTFGPDGNPQGYANWYFVADAPADRRASVFSSIALEKARILAYVDDYHDSLAGFFGSVFQKEASQGANSQVLPGIQRMPSVFRGGSTGHKYAKASGTNSLQSTHRKAWAVGIYAFHAILRQHLGTYNLAALPAFGANPELDRRVHNALLDALATQWWITAEAYNTGSTAKATDPVVTDNLMTKELLEVPYLKRFYDKERVWQQVGAQEFVFFSAASDSPDANNAYSHEGNQVEGLNLGGARTYLEQPLTGPFAAKIASYWGTKFKSFLDLHEINFFTTAGVEPFADPLVIGVIPTSKKEISGDLAGKIRGRLTELRAELSTSVNDARNGSLGIVAQITAGWTSAYNDSMRGRAQRIEERSVGVDKTTAARQQDYVALFGGTASLDVVKKYNLDAQGTEAIDTKLAEELALLRTAASVSAKNPGGIAQADFNRTVAGVLELLILRLNADNLRPNAVAAKREAAIQKLNEDYPPQERERSGSVGSFSQPKMRRNSE